MKIAHIVCTYPPYYGGMGNVVFNLANELSTLGHEVEVLTPGFYENKEIRDREVEPVKNHVPELTEQIDYVTRLTPRIQYGNAAYLPQIQNELDRFDLVHLHYPFFGTANLVRRWKKKHPEKPLVITYHMDTRSPGWKGLFFKYYAKFWLPKILSTADKLLVSSFDYLENSDAAELFARTRAKWEELPLGVDTERFFPADPLVELVREINLDLQLPTVLFVGGMDAAHYFKGVNILLQALYILKRNNTPVQAVLVGEGELRTVFEERSRLMGLTDLVHFVGKVSEEKLPEYYHLANLLVLPSLNRGEAFGMVILEAFASGVPVVASDLPGVRAVAGSGGVLVPAGKPEELAEAIYGYFDDLDLVRTMPEKVRLLSEEVYAWPRIAKKLDNIYQQLAQ